MAAIAISAIMMMLAMSAGERAAQAEVRQQRGDAETGRETGDRPEPAVAR